MRTLFAQWRWRIQRRLGRTRLLALLMLGASVALATAIPSLQSDNDTLRARVLRAARTGAAATAKDLEPPRIPVSTQVDEFVSAFPLMGQSADDLETVFRSAERHGVRLTRGEYQLRQDPYAPLVALQATFPIKSDYRHIKDFTADVLKALPHVAMEDLHMARSEATTPTLDAVVRFSLVYRRP